MSNHTTTKYQAKIIKSGNSYALRVPKSYADEHDLRLGQVVEVEVSTAQEFKVFDREAASRILAEIHKRGPIFPEFKTVEDIVEWQREIRRDRPILGRDY